MLVLLVCRGISELSFLVRKEFVDFILAQEWTRKLHFDNAYLIKLIETVIVVFWKTNFEVLRNQIQVNSFKLSGLVITACIVV